MIPLPKWLREPFKKSVCPYCESAGKTVHCKKGGVFGIGIRREKGAYVLFFEYRCHECKKESVFTGFETTFDEYIEDMMDIADEAPAVSEKPKPKKGMTDKEVEEAKRLLDESSSFQDFLHRLGISDQFSEEDLGGDEEDEEKDENK